MDGMEISPEVKAILKELETIHPFEDKLTVLLLAVDKQLDFTRLAILTSVRASAAVRRLGRKH